MRWFATKSGALAPSAEAEGLEGDEDCVGEGVVDHSEVDVGVGKSRHFQRPRPGLPGYSGSEVSLLQDTLAVVVTFGCPEDPDGFLLSALGYRRRSDDRCAAAIGDEAAVGEVEGPGDPAGLVVVIDGHGVLYVGLGVELGPLTGRHGYLCEGVASAFLAELVHVACAGQGVGVRLDDQAVGVFILGDGHVWGRPQRRPGCSVPLRRAR